MGFIFSEVDRNGHDLLDVYLVGDYWSYRAIKVPTTQLDLDTLRKTAGQYGRRSALRYASGSSTASTSARSPWSATRCM